MGTGSQFVSMLSTKDSIAHGSSNRSLAVYKGLKVAVETVDKPEINLTRQDLLELVNVRGSLFMYYNYKLTNYYLLGHAIDISTLDYTRSQRFTTFF